MTSQVVWEDEYGEVIDRPQDDILEIRWFDATSAFTGDSFNVWLAGFAGAVENTKRPLILVDSAVFKMDMSKIDGAWRNANIIPRYNTAGVKKFAFLLPSGTPGIGAVGVEGPATFPTAYFGTRKEAITWLKS